MHRLRHDLAYDVTNNTRDIIIWRLALWMTYTSRQGTAPGSRRKPSHVVLRSLVWRTTPAVHPYS